MRLLALLFCLYIGVASAGGFSKNVLVVYAKKLPLIKAIESVLQEEGVSYQTGSIYSLLDKDPEDVLDIFPVIIIPDRVNQSIPYDLRFWFKNYVMEGGNVFIIYDAGVKDIYGRYREKPVFSELTGVNYCTYFHKREKAYTVDFFRIREEVLEELDIPPGKTINGYISGYKYGKLRYPVADTELIDKNVHIIAETGSGKVGASLKKSGKGWVLFVNLPLCHLKANSDDLPLRVFIRYFLFNLSNIPHLVNVPYGRGGLVINWHIDSYLDWKSIPMMIREGYYNKELVYSSHITAGDFLEKPGDGLGFDACGRGRKIARMLNPYGITGSHGGWAHNWFAERLREGKFSREEIKRYIKINNECLEKIAGYKIREYSAPQGVHPQPVTTEVLEELGMVAYYYTGDSGSSPNRTFYNGKMVSRKVLAFPITPLEDVASLYEMSEKGFPRDKVGKWLKGMVDFVVERRTIRLIYSHPYDIPHYPEEIKNFINYAIKKVREGKLSVKPMVYFYEYMERFLNTRYRFIFGDGEFKAEISSSKSLRGIPVAVPKKFCQKPNMDVSFEDENYLYFVINEDIKSFSLKCSYGNTG
ncbi:polysaccharide deacetylase family protein [Persephonella sp.]